MSEIVDQENKMTSGVISGVVSDVTPDTAPDMDVVSDVVPITQEETKIKKANQLREARLSKKRKKQEKEEEDRKIREALLRYEQKEKSRQDAKQKRKRARDSDGDDDDDDDDDNDDVDEKPNKKRRKPIKVTRSNECDDGDTYNDKTAEKQQTFAQQAMITGIVGTLGLASWYVQNRLFAAKSHAPSKKKIQTSSSATNPKSMPIQTQKKTHPVRPMFFNQKMVKKNIGSSGFTV